MLISLFDAPMPTIAAKPQMVNGGQEGSIAFDAVLTGLQAELAPLPGNPAATPGGALPPTGKTLPDRAVAIDEPGLPALDSAVSAAPYATAASEAEPSVTITLPAASTTAATSLMIAAVPEAAPLPMAAASMSGASMSGAMAVPGPPTAAPEAPSRNDSASQRRSATRPLHSLPPPTPIAAAPVESDRSRPFAGSQATAAAQTAVEPRAIAAQTTVTASEAPSPAQAPIPARSPAPDRAILATGAKNPANGIDPAPLRRGSENKLSLASLTITPDPSAPIALAAPATIFAVPTSGMPASIAPDMAASLAQPPSQTTAQTTAQSAAQAIALPDHRALVDALVRARAERDPGITVALETREFGSVAVRFDTLQSATGDRSLQIALSSNDPGFERAVASAAAAQAALADSGRTPANRPDPAATRSAELPGNQAGGDTGASHSSSGRSPQPDAQAQHRDAADRGSRDARSGQSPGPLNRDGEPVASTRLDRRRGSIFA